jgi:alkanesulfonate monooxygenase SsuD/methylene tetrahydromethanopterin reductase-like flavin-dependent oxidoreductase (luciferase family)
MIIAVSAADRHANLLHKDILADCDRWRPALRCTACQNAAKRRGSAPPTLAQGWDAVKVSYFETGRYLPPPGMPREWPVPGAAYDPVAGAESYRGMVDRVRFVEELGFDWISVSEHHYSPRILTPSPVVSAAFLAARVERIKIALLGPIVPTGNPIRIAEELAMLDTMAPGRIVVGLLRGTTNEYLSYDLNPAEARERTDEGMALILTAWTEPQPFAWQGRYFQYRTVSVWPRPQQPPPPTYALGTSAEAGEFAARHRIGLGVSYGTFESMGRATGYYRQRCAEYGWEPGPDDIIYRANMILGPTDDAAEEALAQRDKQAPFPITGGLKEALLQADTTRNIAGEKRPANVGGVLPISFCGGPDRVVEQIRRCRDEIGAGVLDLSLQDPGAGDVEGMMRSLELFGEKVLPRIRDI